MVLWYQIKRWWEKKHDPVEIPIENSTNLNEKLNNNSSNINVNSNKQLKMPFQVNKNNFNIIPNQMIQIPSNSKSKQAFFQKMKLIQNKQELNDFEMAEEYENPDQEHYEDDDYSDYPEDDDEYQHVNSNYYYHKNKESDLSDWDDEEEDEESNRLNFNNPTTSNRVNKHI